MEFVTVMFPTSRGVNIDGAPRGRTGQLLRLQAGTHRFDLGVPADYAPPNQTLAVVGTTAAAPLEVAFTSALSAAPMAVVGAARLPSKKRKTSKRKTTKRKTTSRKTAKRKTRTKKSRAKRSTRTKPR